MKVLVLRDAAGKIQSVAVPNPKLRGLQVEIEGGTVEAIDAAGIKREDLMGKRGRTAQNKAHEKLRKLVWK